MGIERPLDAFDALGDVFDGARVTQAYVPLHPELLARHGDHQRPLQQEARELLRFRIVRAEIGQAIEGAARAHDTHAVEGLEVLEHDVAVVLDRQAQRLHRALQAGQRAFGRRLQHLRGARGGLRLDIGHDLDHLAIGDHPADAETGHAVQLLHPVDGDDTLAFYIAGSVFVRGGRLAAVEYQLVIDVVGDEIDILALAELDDGRHEFVGIHHPGGVVGRVDDDGLGVAGYRALDLLHARVERAVFRGDDDRHAVDHLHHLRVAHPVGRQDDDFILRVEQREEYVVERLLRAGRDDHVFGGHYAVVILFGVADDGFLERGHAVGRRVLDVALVEARGRTEDGGNRGAVLGFADAQVNHRLAAFAQQARLFIEFERRRFGDGSSKLTEGHVGRDLPMRAVHLGCLL